MYKPPNLHIPDAFEDKYNPCTKKPQGSACGLLINADLPLTDIQSLHFANRSGFESVLRLHKAFLRS